MASVVEYYENTGLDYRVWSREFNMHFGYWRLGLNPFEREPMLEEMNLQVFSELQLQPGEQTIFDLGCGLGATMRSLIRQNPRKRVTGLTLVPWQVQQAKLLNTDYGDRLQVIQADYTRSGLPSESADAAYALESSCHAPGETKAAFIRELYRLLKPGARFAIADGFTLRHSRPDYLQHCLDIACQGWALPCFPNLPGFVQELQAVGMEELKARDISWQIAPSVAHSPLAVVGFTLSRMLRGEKLNAIRKAHLQACFVSLFIGMHRNHFGYYLISGRKPG